MFGFDSNHNLIEFFLVTVIVFLCVCCATLVKCHHAQIVNCERENNHRRRLEQELKRSIHNGTLGHNVIHNNIANLQRENDTLKKQASSSEAKVVDLQSQLIRSSSVHERAKKHIYEQSQKAIKRELRSAAAQSTAPQEKLQESLDSAKAELSQERNARHDADSENAALRQQIAQLNQRLLQEQSDNAAQKRDQISLQQTLAQARISLETVNANMAILSAEKDLLQSHYAQILLAPSSASNLEHEEDHMVLCDIDTNPMVIDAQVESAEPMDIVVEQTQADGTPRSRCFPDSLRPIGIRKSTGRSGAKCRTGLLKMSEPHRQLSLSRTEVKCRVSWDDMSRAHERHERSQPSFRCRDSQHNVLEPRRRLLRSRTGVEPLKPSLRKTTCVQLEMILSGAAPRRSRSHVQADTIMSDDGATAPHTTVGSSQAPWPTSNAPTVPAPALPPVAVTGMQALTCSPAQPDPAARASAPNLVSQTTTTGPKTVVPPAPAPDPAVGAQVTWTRDVQVPVPKYVKIRKPPAEDILFIKRTPKQKQPVSSPSAASALATLPPPTPTGALGSLPQPAQTSVSAPLPVAHQTPEDHGGPSSREAQVVATSTGSGVASTPAVPSRSSINQANIGSATAGETEQDRAVARLTVEFDSTSSIWSEYRRWKERGTIGDSSSTQAVLTAWTGFCSFVESLDVVSYKRHEPYRRKLFTDTHALPLACLMSQWLSVLPSSVTFDERKPIEDKLDLVIRTADALWIDTRTAEWESTLKTIWGSDDIWTKSTIVRPILPKKMRKMVVTLT